MAEYLRRQGLASPRLEWLVDYGLRDRGSTGLTWYWSLAGREPREARSWLESASREDLAEIALSDLAPAHPDLREMTTRIDVMKWGHAMIRPVPGFRFGADRAAAAEPLRGIHFAHSDLSGLALFEEAFFHGERAAREVLAEQGRSGTRS